MPNGNAPEISVVIPAFNASATLGHCLSALAEQADPHPDFEVILVDDGSTDDTAAIARAAGVRVECVAHAGRAAARNHGAHVARGSILLFTDSDCEPRSDWVARLSEPFADPTVAGARGVYLTRQGSLVARFVQLEYEDKYRRLKPLQTIDFVDTYSAAYRRELFLAHGGFNPSFRFDEDQELSFRLASQGLRLVFVPEAGVYHNHTISLGAYLKKKLGIGFWKAAVVLLHPNKLARDTHTPFSQRAQLLLLYVALALAVAAAFGALSFWYPVGTALALTATTLPFAWRAARKDHQVAWVSPVLLWGRALALGLGFAAGLLRFLPARIRRR